MKFKELELSPELLKSVERAGFEEATPIQSETIPLALAGKRRYWTSTDDRYRENSCIWITNVRKIDPDRHELQGFSYRTNT